MGLEDSIMVKMNNRQPVLVRVGWLLDPMSGDVPTEYGYQVRGIVSPQHSFSQDYLTRAQAERVINEYLAKGYVAEVRDRETILTRTEE